MKTYMKISKSISISNFYRVKVQAPDGRDSLYVMFYILLCDILLQIQYKVLEYAYCRILTGG